MSESSYSELQAHRSLNVFYQNLYLTDSFLEVTAHEGILLFKEAMTPVNLEGSLRHPGAVESRVWKLRFKTTRTLGQSFIFRDLWGMSQEICYQLCFKYQSLEMIFSANLKKKKTKTTQNVDKLDQMWGYMPCMCFCFIWQNQRPCSHSPPWPPPPRAVLTKSLLLCPGVEVSTCYFWMPNFYSLCLIIADSHPSGEFFLSLVFCLSGIANQGSLLNHS